MSSCPLTDVREHVYRDNSTSFANMLGITSGTSRFICNTCLKGFEDRIFHHKQTTNLERSKNKLYKHKSYFYFVQDWLFVDFLYSNLSFFMTDDRLGSLKHVYHLKLIVLLIKVLTSLLLTRRFNVIYF